jgi:hypothetical protein
MKKISFILSACVASVLINACSSTDRFGTLLGPVNNVENSAEDIKSLRSILGTPAYSANLDCNTIFVYKFSVHYPYEGIFSPQQINALTEDNIGVPYTSKYVTFLVNQNGAIKETKKFGLKYIHLIKLQEGNNAYCLTELTPEEMDSFVNFSRHQIEAYAGNTTKPTDLEMAIEDKIKELYPNSSNFCIKVKRDKEDGSNVSKAPYLTRKTFCNKFVCK